MELEAASFWKSWIRVKKCEEIMKICGNSKGAGVLCWVYRERNKNENGNDILRSFVHENENCIKLKPEKR
jgi:hypothetical protein